MRKKTAAGIIAVLMSVMAILPSVSARAEGEMQTRYMEVILEYLDEEGEGARYVDQVLCTVGEPTSDVVSRVGLPGDADRSRQFLGWKCWWGDDTVTNDSEQYLVLTATYASYPLTATRIYIDSNGEVKTEVEKRDYPAGTRYEDILAQYTTSQPLDMAANFSQWHVFDPWGEVRTEGEICVENNGLDGVWSSYFDLVAEYEDKAIVNVVYNYTDASGEDVSDSQFIVCGIADVDNQEAILAAAAAAAPTDHFEEADFSGDWSIAINEYTKNSETIYELTAQYNKVKIILETSVTDGTALVEHTRELIWENAGKSIQLPEGYEWYTSNGDVITEFTIPENPDAEYTLYGFAEKEEDPGEDTNPGNTSSAGDDTTPSTGDTADTSTDNSSDPADGGNTDTTPYQVELTSEQTVISADAFTTLLTENANRPVVIKSNEDVTFTFAAGTMKVVESKTDYDFGVKVVKQYDRIPESVQGRVSQDNFVAHIEYNYSGQLPAAARIRIRLGSEYIGKTLYYYLENEDGSLKYIQSVAVDSEGYITVTQSHCSNYVLLDQAVGSDMVKTGDTTPVSLYGNLLLTGAAGMIIAAGVVVRQRRRAR